MKKENAKKHILELEKKFAEDIKEYGIEAWYKYLAEDAIIATSGHEGLVIGKKEIMERFEELYKLEYFIYDWEPIFVDVSEDCTLAYCITHYYMEYKVDEDVFKFKGKDCNIWRLVDGEYKLELEIGNKIED